MNHSLHLNCKKATEMVEQQAVVQLSFLENLKLKFHLMVCKTCHAYFKQSKAIDTFFKHNTETSLSNKATTNNDTLKNNMINNLKRW